MFLWKITIECSTALSVGVPLISTLCKNAWKVAHFLSGYLLIQQNFEKLDLASAIAFLVRQLEERALI